MTDLRNLAERAASWQRNGDTPTGTSRDWESFQRAASPDVVLALLDERDRLREAVAGVEPAVYQLARRMALSVPGEVDPAALGREVAAVANALPALRAALQESPDDR